MYMKISQMIKREDFYRINAETLDRYFGQYTDVKTKLYVYPQLNAIITARPSKQVKEYLLCEYKVRGSYVKRMIASLYVEICLSSLGIMSSHKYEVASDVTSDVLIYPCNKKYRIFDFAENVTEVIPKESFPLTNLKREIEFRTSRGIPDFVPRMISYSDRSE